MSLASYTDLQTQIGNWLARDDLAAYIPDFITLFEATAARRMKTRPSGVTTTLTPTSGRVLLPDDFLGVIRLTWTGSPLVELDYLAPTYFSKRFANVTEDVPSSYTLEGSYLKVGASNDTALQLVYNQRTLALSGQLSWLFTRHPDAYLFGSLCEANAFDKAVDPAGLWKARRDEVFNEILMEDFNELPGMTMRVVGPTP